MTMNDSFHLDEERIDAVDHLIFRELGAQEQWAQTMQRWEERQRQQRRLRILPVLSNIASVAALFILGLIMEAMVPGLRVTDSLVWTSPSPETVAAPDSTAAASASDTVVP